MTDGQLALKAAKLAGMVMGGLVVVIFVCVGVSALALRLLGGLGAGLLYFGFLFALFWLCAAMDIQRQEDRKDAAQAGEAGTAETGNTDSARRASTRSRRDAPKS